MNMLMERQTKTYNYLLFLGIMLAVLGVGLVFFGYGSIENNTSDTAQVRINGHFVASDSIKVRPGSYEVEITSARFAPVRKTIRVGLFGTATLTNPTKPRDPDQLIRSAIAAYGSYGPPELNSVRWLENSTWLVGYVGPGGAMPIALKYTDNTWQVGYFNTIGYPHNLKTLPDSVASVIESYAVREQ